MLRLHVIMCFSSRGGASSVLCESVHVVQEYERRKQWRCVFRLWIVKHFQKEIRLSHLSEGYAILSVCIYTQVRQCMCFFLFPLNTTLFLFLCYYTIISLGSVRFVNVFERRACSTYQGCIYLIKNTIKTVILWTKIAVSYVIYCKK